MFAALRDDVVEQIELLQDGVEPKPKHREHAAAPSSASLERACRGFEPVQERVHPRLQISAALRQEGLDRHL